MSRKLKVLLITYLSVGLAVFSLWVWQSRRSLADYRLLARYSAARAFEETVNSVDALSTALQKSLYATDPGMSAGVCTEIYARALSAAAAMSALPFETYELEQVSSFLSISADYARALNYKASEQGFSEEEQENLADMAELAEDFADYLRQTRQDVNSGALMMDSRERDYRNVAMENDAEKLSAGLLSYERGFKGLGELAYDGKYGKVQEKSASGELKPEDMAVSAADFAGVELSELQKEYDYEGSAGRSCFSAGDMHICVSRAGVESVTNSRLVGDVNISKEEAERLGAEFLKSRGYEKLELWDSSVNGAVCSMRFVKTQSGALCLDNYLSLSVAMDDGSLYDFNALNFDPGETELKWELSEEQAAEALPEKLRFAGVKKVICRSPGGRELPCYLFSCSDRQGRGVKIFVDGESGRQFDIKIEKRS